MGLGMLLSLGGIGCRETERIERVGIPEGSTGLLTAYVLKEKMGRDNISAVRFEPYALYDCCAAATQYALGSGHLDLAVMCPDAATALIAKDQRFVVVGPVMYNSDVVVRHHYRRRESPTIAISQNRERQRQLLTAFFGDKIEVAPMLHSAVPFAYARDRVDGAVLDIAKAFSLVGEMTGHQENSEVVTGVLVAKRTVLASDQYRHFVSGYRQALEEMRDHDKLLQLLKENLSQHIDHGDITTWKAMNVKFANPFDSRRPE